MWKKILYNGTRIFFHNRVYKKGYNRGVCPLCSKKIHEGDEVYLIINNYILFPNIFVHKTCVNSKKDCVKQLKSSYDRYKKFVKEYSFWNRNED